MTINAAWARQQLQFQRRLIRSLKGERVPHSLSIELLLRPPGLTGVRASKYLFVRKKAVSWQGEFFCRGRISRQGFHAEEHAARFVLDALVERAGVAGARRFIKEGYDRMVRQEGGQG